jgi:NAD(P)H-hydrate repair Nnr-like enzyme with NAD(P)H-hydrate dehydratase domain
MPYITIMTKLCEVINELNKRPIMIADAGSMYAAKASGMAENFDVFTPDATEMAFLADSNATHPAYIAKHFFDNDITQTPKLVKIAYKNKDIAKLLLVKGSTDYIALDGNIIDVVNKPDIPAMEAIGGTGDTITGLISALIYSGLDLKKAALVAARSNRIAGEYAKANPATKISQIIAQFPSAFQKLKL